MSDTVKKAKKQGQAKDIWKRFRKNTAAMAGLVVLVILVLVAIFADVITKEGLDYQDLNRTFITPSRDHVLGTDHLGRDQLTRIIYGSRTSLMVGFIVVSVALLAGGLIGALAGFYGGKVDNFLMRGIDILMCIPSLILAIAIASALGTGLINMMIAVGISAIPGYARVTRSSVLTIREQEFIEAARSIGANDFRLILRHILPNSMAPIIVQSTMGIAGAILSAAALSFIGLGIQPPTPEWGFMLSIGRRYFRDFPHLTVFPGLAIVIVVLALNLVGDGLRDALDPKLKK